VEESMTAIGKKVYEDVLFRIRKLKEENFKPYADEIH
jgi:hypothetical protein